MNRITVVGTVLLTVLVFAGCGSAQAGSSHTDSARIELDSLDGQVGQLRLLSVAVASPGARGSMHIAGDSAALFLSIANDGKAEDVLIGASADVTKQVVFRNGDDPPDPHLQVRVPPGGLAVLDEVTGPHLELFGLRETLRGGFSVPVTFEFRDAGSVTLKVPIRTYTDVPVDRIPQPLSVG
jgi:periplasmic copper chaperone A